MIGDGHKSDFALQNLIVLWLHNVHDNWFFNGFMKATKMLKHSIHKKDENIVDQQIINTIIQSIWNIKFLAFAFTQL